MGKFVGARLWHNFNDCGAVPGKMVVCGTAGIPLGPSGLAAGFRAAAGALGDLTAAEAQAIPNVVNQAGRPIEVVGSAARGARTAGSDIDYVVPPSSLKYFDGLEGNLPGIDPSHGLIPGMGNPFIGPVIRFEPVVTTFP